MGLRCFFLALCAGGIVAGQTAPGIQTFNYGTRSIRAVSYRVNETSMVDLKGTPLAASARGTAKVKMERGAVSIEAQMERLTEASAYGAQYQTYVLWGVTPEGRVRNLGELVTKGGKAKLSTTAPLQDFGMIVTAEPYFSVTIPSYAVVAENVVSAGTLGRISTVDVKYELFRQGHYDQIALNLGDAKTPGEVKQARLAVEVARRAGAARYAAEGFAKAEGSLEQAEQYLRRKGDNRKPAAMVAREASQSAEDARVVALKRIGDERLATERREATEREATAKNAAQEQARRAEEAARQQREAEAAKGRAEQERQLAVADARTAQAMREAALAAQREAEAKREAALAAQKESLEQKEMALAAQRESEAQKTSAVAAQREAEAQRAAAVLAQREAEARREAAVAAQAEAVKQREAALEARRESEKAEKAAVAAAAEAKAQREAAERERTQLALERNQALEEKRMLRSRLLEQFNSVLDTKDTDRGLVLNMGEVLFDTGKFTLRATAREGLARVAGILGAYPGLKLEIEGHTDSTGSDELNLRLSKQRAEEVQQYLVEQKVAAGRMQAAGFGKARPIASNEKTEGRQRNRRVEIVVSGEVIGVNLKEAVK